MKLVFQKKNSGKVSLKTLICFEPHKETDANKRSRWLQYLLMFQNRELPTETLMHDVKSVVSKEVLSNLHKNFLINLLHFRSIKIPTDITEKMKL